MENFRKQILIDTINEINNEYERLNMQPMNRKEIVDLAKFARFKINEE